MMIDRVFEKYLTETMKNIEEKNDRKKAKQLIVWSMFLSASMSQEEAHTKHIAFGEVVDFWWVLGFL